MIFDDDDEVVEIMDSQQTSDNHPRPSASASFSFNSICIICSKEFQQKQDPVEVIRLDDDEDVQYEGMNLVNLSLEMPKTIVDEFHIFSNLVALDIPRQDLEQLFYLLIKDLGEPSFWGVSFCVEHATLLQELKRIIKTIHDLQNQMLAIKNTILSKTTPDPESNQVGKKNVALERIQKCIISANKRGSKRDTVPEKRDDKQEGVGKEGDGSDTLKRKPPKKKRPTRESKRSSAKKSGAKTVRSTYARSGQEPKVRSKQNKPNFKTRKPDVKNGSKNPSQIRNKPERNSRSRTAKIDKISEIHQNNTRPRGVPVSPRENIQSRIEDMCKGPNLYECFQCKEQFHTNLEMCRHKRFCDYIAF